MTNRMSTGTWQALRAAPICRSRGVAGETSASAAKACAAETAGQGRHRLPQPNRPKTTRQYARKSAATLVRLLPTRREPTARKRSCTDIEEGAPSVDIGEKKNTIPQEKLLKMKLICPRASPPPRIR